MNQIRYFAGLSLLLPLAIGCAGRTAPFNEMDQAQITVLRLSQAPAPTPVTPAATSGIAHMRIRSMKIPPTRPAAVSTAAAIDESRPASASPIRPPATRPARTREARDIARYGTPVQTTTGGSARIRRS